jgi:hypothetical protein
MTDVGSDLTGCDDALPHLGVTRQFDFGQFVELFDSTPDPRNPNEAIVARIVIRPGATLAADRATTRAAFRMSSPVDGAAPAPGQPVAGREVQLFDLVEEGPGAKLDPVRAEIDDAEAFFGHGQVVVDGRTYRVAVDDDLRDALGKGLVVTTFAETPVSDDQSARVPVSLSLSPERVDLTTDEMVRVIAGGTVGAAGGQVTPRLDAGAIKAMLRGRRVWTHAELDDGTTVPVAFSPPGSGNGLASDRYEIFDLGEFIADPWVMGARGERVDLEIDAGSIRELIEEGRTEVPLNGSSLTLDVVEGLATPAVLEFERLRSGGLVSSEVGVPPVKPRDDPWDDVIEQLGGGRRTPDHFVVPGDVWLEERLPRLPGTLDDGRTGGGGVPDGPPGDPSMTDKVQPRLPTGTGLPVAVFVPWRQTWTLKGFSRGNLLHSIALAPDETVTLQVFSWERRTRSLDQSSETEVDQSTETTNTTRDTEDVFREMVSKQEFAWQLAGSLDASYNNGVASIQVGVDGSVSDTTSIEQTARTSSQRVRESTTKASARVRSRRVTRITQTVETGREERVTRVIRNPNQCHTLTLDFFEALAHYEVALEFRPDRMRLVVLLPNPMRHQDFSSEIVRRNETTLRNALLEPALADSFEACRMVAAYEEAKVLVAAQQAESAKAEELRAQRDQAAPPSAPDPAAPQQAEVERIVGEMLNAIRRIRSEADIDRAMTTIQRDRPESPVTEEMRRRGQYWVFVNVCANKFPSLLTTLDELSRGGPATVTTAQRLIAVLPRADAPTNLGNLNEMSDKDKEQAGIASKISQYMGSATWNWAWWSGRLRDEGLYMANDAGLGGLAAELPRAYEAWETKKAQGAAMKDQEVAKTEAEGRQDKATAEDKLAMAFPLDELARAQERQKVLRDHLNEHRDFYNHALFQALPPSEQVLQIIQASNGRLQVGVFEPRVVAMSGDRLAVPLTPMAGSQSLRAFVTALRTSLEGVFDDELSDAETAILPTPGVSVSTRLGDCSACEEYVEQARTFELARLEALAEQETSEAERRRLRLEAEDLDTFQPAPTALRLAIETTEQPTP